MPASDQPTRDADATDRAIRALYLEGRHTDREIALALGIHRTTVTRRRLAMGVTRHDRKPASAA